MKVVITDEKRRQRNTKKTTKKANWFASWKAKRVAEGTWKDSTSSGGKK